MYMIYSIIHFIVLDILLIYCQSISLTNGIKRVSVAATKKQTIDVGSIQMSPLGCGTWSWGNRFLWQYDVKGDSYCQVAMFYVVIALTVDIDDENLKKTYDYVIRNGINWFDTADSYGTGMSMDLLCKIDVICLCMKGHSMVVVKSFLVSFLMIISIKRYL